MILYKAIDFNDNKRVFSYWLSVMITVIIKFTIELLVYPDFLKLDQETINNYIYYVYVFELVLISTYAFWTFFILRFCMQTVYKHQRSAIMALLQEETDVISMRQPSAWTARNSFANTQIWSKQDQDKL